MSIVLLNRSRAEEIDGDGHGEINIFGTDSDKLDTEEDGINDHEEFSI